MSSWKMVTAGLVAGAAIGLSGCTIPIVEQAELSPCDVRAETAHKDSIIGTLASRQGYPRLAVRIPWLWEELVYEDTIRSEAGRQTLMVPDQRVVIALTGGTTYENEVHDCQRLVTSSGERLAFGPLVGLMPLDQAMDSAITDADFTAGLPVATIFNWGDFVGDEVAYEPLGIKDGWSCLFLRQFGQDDWRAAVLVNPDDDTPCYRHEAPADAAPYTLAVQRLTYPGAVMPPTARWGFDHGSNEHTMGVKCGSAWCTISRPDVVNGAPVWTLPSVDLSGADPRTSIPGYSDAQHLAVYVHGVLEPGPWGEIAPASGFFQRAMSQIGDHQTDYFDADFKVGLAVADLMLRDPHPIEGFGPYQDKFGLYQGRSTLSIQTRGPLPDTPQRYTALTASALLTTTGIQASYNDSNDNSVAARSVTYIPQTEHAATGAVRWRWHDTRGSESAWSCCNKMCEACCDSN